MKESTPFIYFSQIGMDAPQIRERLTMECLEGVWETLNGHERCRFRGTVRLSVSSLIHPEQPVRTMQQTIEWIMPTPTPYRLVEPVSIIEVSSSEEDPEEDPDALPPDLEVDAPVALEDEEDPLPDVNSPEDIMPVSEADSTDESGPAGVVDSDDSSL